jgi:hypothetical protein
MRRMRTAVLLVVAVSVLAPVQARAFHDPPTPVLSTTTFANAGWAAYRISVPEGAQYGWEVSGDAQGRHFVGHLQLIQADGSFSGTSLGGCRSLNAYVLLDDEPFVAGDLACKGGVGGIAVDVSDATRGVYTLVAIGASEEPMPGKITLYGSEGVTVLASASGDDAFLSLDADFEGTVNAGLDTPGGGAQAMFLTGAAHTVTNSLYGAFWNLGFFLPAFMSVDGPDERGPAPTTFMQFSGSAAGDYTFKVDLKAELAPLVGSHVILIGADIALPGPAAE